MLGRSVGLVLLACAVIAGIVFAVSSNRSSASAAPPPQTWDEARSAYQQGIRAEDEGKYPAAIRHFNRAIEIDPVDDSAYLHRGICRLGLGESELAISDFTRALQIQPENSKAFQYRAVAYHRQGKYAEAITDLDEAIQRNPSMATYYILRGQTRAMQRQPDRAIDDYTQALTLQPSAQAYLDRAEAFLRIGERDRAVGDLNRALTMGARLVRPDDLLALLPAPMAPSRPTPAAVAPARPSGRAVLRQVFQARSRVEQGLYDEALELFEEAIRANPKLPVAFNSRGYAYLRRKNYEQAIADFNEAIRLNAQYLNAFHNRAVARRLAGDREGYLEDRRRELELRRRRRGN